MSRKSNAGAWGIPSKAQVNDLADIFDIIFEFVDLINAIMNIILNFGDFLSGRRPPLGSDGV
jgi:hypothetical protein